MFEGITEELEERELSEGEILLTQGEVTPSVYILKDGALLVTIEGDEVCRVCTPESVFGEVSVLLGIESTGTVTALEPTTVWVVEDLCSFMKTHPAFAVTVARELAMRLNNMNINFLEVRTAMQNLEDRFMEQVMGGDTAPIGKEDVERMKRNEDGETGIIDEPDEMITVKRGKKIVITGLIKKVDEALNKRTF